MKVCIDKGTDNGGCCKAWTKGIRTINNQYPDDNREFGILEGTGIVITPETAGIRIACTVPTADTLTAGDNIDISPGGSDKLVVSLVSDPEISGNVEVNGTTILNDDLQVNGDIIQNGSAYETHAEKIYTTNDYIITRDGAISALSAGDYSGFQVKKYDGTNDGRLVIDNAGVARVGDVGDEQPLLTRAESAQLNNGDLLQWNSTTQKAVSASVNTSQIVRGTGNIGSDTKPVKVVNGVANPITNDLALANWTNVTNDLSKMQTAHEILFFAVENNTFIHSTLIPGSKSSVYVGVSAGGNYLNVLIQASGITTISSAGTWTQLSVYVR